jgi:hypothetical protein
MTRVSEDTRIREARVIDLDLFLESANEEVILIVLSHQAGVSESIDIDLVVMRAAANVRNDELPGINHSEILQAVPAAR